MRVDLNADVGESAVDSPALIRTVTSVNIACGLHAGTPSTIRRYLRISRDLGLAAGAHPSFADRDTLGRVVRLAEPTEVEDLVLYQVSALAGLATAESTNLTHVKPHGAMYHLGSVDERVANAIARATAGAARNLRLVAFAGSRLIDAGKQAGLVTIAEAFADRAYAADGRLVSRDHPDALIHDPVKAAAQALRIVLDGQVRAIDGSTLISVAAQTLCVHGDTPGAAAIAAEVRNALERAGVVVAAPEIPPAHA